VGSGVPFELWSVEVFEDVTSDRREERLTFIGDASALTGSGGDEAIVFERL
jgi:hypothetical protein